MAREPVAVGTALALVFPFFLVALLDVVVMDRHEQIDTECVRPLDPLEQLRPRGTWCDEEMRLAETGVLERLLYVLRQAEIENVFPHAACAGCALVFNRMPDVERDLEALGLAGDDLSLGAGFRGRTCWLAHQETHQETFGYDCSRCRAAHGLHQRTPHGAHAREAWRADRARPSWRGRVAGVPTQPPFSVRAAGYRCYPCASRFPLSPRRPTDAALFDHGQLSWPAFMASVG